MHTLLEPEARAPRGPTQPPRMFAFGDVLAPEASMNTHDAGLSERALSDLTLKLASTVYDFTTEWAAERLHLPLQFVEEILTQLGREAMLETLGQVTPFSHRYAISGRGVERSRRLMEICGYIGPAPVSLEAYKAMLTWQIARFPVVHPRDAQASLSDLVLEDECKRLSGLALSSGRSLFLHGPAGNGKTSIGRLLHRALEGELWIPYAIEVDGNILRVFDTLCHQVADLPQGGAGNVDRRWVRIRRPLIVAGGELTIDALDLTYSPTLRYYDVPLHMKANGGIFLIDDFGRQRVEPRELLNRWIMPLEYQVDNLSLRTGQQIQVPFLQTVVIATNLDPADVTDSAFLRRIGYRVHVDSPTPERYAEIFESHAARRGLSVPAGLIKRLIARHDTENRELRSCDPHDLIDRVVDLCRFKDQSPELNDETVEVAWTGYFGKINSRDFPKLRRLRDERP